MKKTLLSVAFLFATFVGANAQQISFEGSEGFSLGSIHGQNGWTVTSVGDGVYSTTQVIVDEQSTDGDYSFKIAGTPEAGGQASHVVGGFLNLTPVAFNTISFDVYVNDDGGSDYSFRAADLDAGFFVAIVYFSYDNTIAVLGGGSDLIGLDVMWEPATWYNVKVEITDTNEIIYTIDDAVVYQGAASDAQSGASIDDIRFVHDNYNQQFETGGAAYLDNLKINDETVSRDGFLTSAFSIYPNPAKDVINVSNATDAIENVTITDMNGRVVKQVAMGVNEGQINISDLSQGVYILNATSNGKSVTEKIVKK